MADISANELKTKDASSINSKNFHNQVDHLRKLGKKSEPEHSIKEHLLVSLCCLTLPFK